MRLSSGLLGASTVGGLLSVAAALLAMPGVSMMFGVVMLLALFGYVVVSPGARPVRWALIAGLGLLAALAAMRLSWYQEQVGDAGWLTYHGRTAMLAHWREAIDQERFAGVWLLLGVLCLAAAVLALPARRGRWWVAPALLALLLLAWLGLSVASQFGRPPLLDLLGTVWPALLGAVLAIGMLAVSGWRADRRWLLPVGSLLLSLWLIEAYSDLAASWLGWWTMANPRDGAFFTSVAVSTSPAEFPQVSRAVAAAIELAGAGLVSVGALNSVRDVDAGKPEADR